MKTTDKYVFFWNGIYSQWYRAPMTIDGISYSSCEQYMMHQKALFFENFKIADQVLSTQDPGTQKSLGRQIKGFNKAAWDKVCLQIVYKGNYAKFTQNEKLKEELLETGNRILVEASPVDFIWGIGKHEDDEDIDNPLNWKGLNLLGWSITLVKQELQK